MGDIERGKFEEIKETLWDSVIKRDILVLREISRNRFRRVGEILKD